MNTLDRIANGMAYGFGGIIGAGLGLVAVTLLTPIVGELLTVYVLHSL